VESHGLQSPQHICEIIYTIIITSASSSSSSSSSSILYVYINYKLKSVAHLPWRVMAYKAFNTFVRWYILDLLVVLVVVVLVVVEVVEL